MQGMHLLRYSMLQIRSGKRDSYEMIFRITPVKHVLTLN